MIHFNELYITEDGKNLIIDVELDDLPGNESCYLDEIVIDTGSKCSTSTLFNNPLSVWKSKKAGDLNGDGVVDAEDYQMLQVLMEVKESFKNTATNTDIKNIYMRDGKYYYRVINPDYDEDHPDKWIEYEIDYDMAQLCFKIAKNYDDLILTGKQPYITPGNILNYITSDFDEDAYRKIAQVITGKDISELTGIPGDVNNDGEANIADLNALIEFVLGLSDGTIDPSDNVVIKERHKRLCLSISDLAGLGILPNQKLDDLYFVRVIAGCDTKTLVNTDCGCMTSQITGAVYNAKPLYDTAVNYAGSYGDTCENNDTSGFVDWILRYYAFQFAIKNGDVCLAWHYWKDYLTGTSKSNYHNFIPCGCHGSR